MMMNFYCSEKHDKMTNERVHSSYQAVTCLTIRIAQTHIPCPSRQSAMTPEDPTELLGVSNG
jgi:hypothetical protein